MEFSYFEPVFPLWKRPRIQESCRVEVIFSSPGVIES